MECGIQGDSSTLVLPLFSCTMKTQILTQLSKCLETTPAYTPRNDVGSIAPFVSAEGLSIKSLASLPNISISNSEDGVNGGGFSGSESFDIPYGTDKSGKPVALTAICSVTLTVDDWGSAYIDGVRVVNLTSEVEAPGEHGGHQVWSGAGCIALSSGSHTLSYQSSNISLPHPEYNISICNVTLSASWEEDGGRDDDDDCDCDDSCPTSGGEPEGGNRAIAAGEPGPKFTSSSAGRGVEASLTQEELRWDCSFGVLRGQGTPLNGKMQLRFKELTSDCASPRGLFFNHPLDARLRLPEGGFHLGERVEIVQGAREVALRSYTDGRIVAVGVDTGEGLATLLANNTKLQWQNNAGQKWVFSLEDGSLLEYVGSNGTAITDASKFLQVRRATDGAIEQIWSYWDGLLQVEAVSSTGYRIALYTASQIQGVSVEGAYELMSGSEAFMSFEVTYEAAENAVSVTNHTPGRADLVYRWMQDAAERSWIFERGMGEEAVVQTCVAKEVEPNILQLVTEMSKGGKAASRTCEVYQITAQGWLCLTRVEGYGEEGALTTTYRYDAAGNQISLSRSDGYWEETWYDEYSRVTKQREPWKDGASILTTDRTYAYSSAEKHNSELRTLERKLILPGGSSMVTLLTEEYAYSKPQAGVERTTITSTAVGATGTRTRIEEKYTDAAANARARGQKRMSQAENGVQTWYEYADTSAYGALYTVTEETRVNGESVSGQSTRKVSYISAEGNTLREESYVLLASGEWALTNGETHGFDVNNRQVSTQMDNGRSSSRALTCQGQPLWKEDEDGVRTTYAYDSARQLIEAIRSATPTTPETVTAYTRDAEGRALVTEECIGAMKRVSSAEYDLQGREVKSTDVLGRITQTAYSDSGLKKTVTTPAGAQLITQNNLAGSVMELSGDGQRGICYLYDYANGIRTTQQLLSSGEMISRTVENGFGETVLSAVATTTKGGSLDTVGTFNNKGQLTRRQKGQLAPTTYAYDSMGNQVRQTQLLDAANPDDATKNVIVKQSQSYEKLDDGVYQITTTESNNAEGAWLTSVQKTLVSQLSPTLESKQISTEARGNTATSWTEYGEGTARKSYQQIPTSNIVAETTVIDGFTTSQTDNVGITTTASRRYLENGMEQTSTDGRGNTTTTLTDIAGRTIEVIDAAGNTTRTTYDPASDNPALIIDALGNTTNYAYDVRGRKVAEYGTAVQPAVFAYDDANRMISLTTWRMGQQTITTDPRGLTGGDTTTWTYNDATGLELGITYASGEGSTKTYNAANQLATETNARGIVTSYTYDEKTGQLIAIDFSAEDTSRQQFIYNFLGQLIQVEDAAGIRSLSYDKFGSLMDEKQGEGESQVTRYELLDAYGRSIGYSLILGVDLLQLVSTDYAADGRINKASFMDAEGSEQKFTYAYLPGSNLLQTLTQPNGVTLTQSYAEKRDLLTNMFYSHGESELTRRSYIYDVLGRPTERQAAQQGREPITDHFGYSQRNELTSAQVSGELYGYDYDNIGNRRLAFGGADYAVYTANELNQYTQIDTNGRDFTPQYDADGNQTLVQTSTGIWKVSYNAQNRAVRFENADSHTIVTCDYDYMGRRIWKKVEQNGETTLHERYLYRNYLQIAALDLLTNTTKHAILWDPTQPTATRPLAIQQGGTWYTYAWDLTKNIIAIFIPDGAISTTYTYTPFGKVSVAGEVEQATQWSSEYHDAELGLIYYNYRYYNPVDGRWTRRDPFIMMDTYSKYSFINNNPLVENDLLGLVPQVVVDFYNAIEGSLSTMSDAAISAVKGEFENFKSKAKWKGVFNTQWSRNLIDAKYIKAKATGSIEGSADGCCVNVSIGGRISASAKGATWITLTGGISIGIKGGYKYCWKSNTSFWTGSAQGTGWLGLRVGVDAWIAEAYIEGGVSLSYKYDFSQDKGGWGIGIYGRAVFKSWFSKENQIKIAYGSSEVDFD